MDAVIVKNLGVKFWRRAGGGSPKRLLRKSLTSIVRRKNRAEEFWALRGISFTVKDGDVLGIVGNNGAGKSTLLKLLVGVLYPDEGSITINGKVSSLLSLGAGFMLDLSGRDNIYLNGAFLGLTRRKLNQIIDDIISFAELEDFIDTPIRHYSSGMKARLGFSIAVHVEPEILIVDEILAAGDKNFREKAEMKMKELMSRARAIIIVSHNTNFISEFCNKAMWLENGSIKAIGAAPAVVDQYTGS